MHHRVPSHKAAARLGSRSPRCFWVPPEKGAEKRRHFRVLLINCVTLVGFVGSDPEKQAKGNGSKFAVLSVATQRSWKNADDEWGSKTDWHRVVVFRPRLAEHVATTIKKGSRPRRRQSRQLDLRTGEMARARRCLWRIAISLSFLISRPATHSAMRHAREHGSASSGIPSVIWSFFSSTSSPWPGSSRIERLVRPQTLTREINLLKLFRMK